jgi:hypothetical protein
LLRGPQTPGELRSRAERLYSFDDLGAVQSTLERLAARSLPDEANPESTGPLTTILPRQPGSREARYAHLLGATPDLSSIPSDSPVPGTTAPVTQRIAQLEAEVSDLSAKLQLLQQRIERIESALEETKIEGL